MICSFVRAHYFSPLQAVDIIRRAQIEKMLEEHLRRSIDLKIVKELFHRQAQNKCVRQQNVVATPPHTTIYH